MILFELSTLHLLSRCSFTWVTPPASNMTFNSIFYLAQYTFIISTCDQYKIISIITYIFLRKYTWSLKILDIFYIHNITQFGLGLFQIFSNCK